MAQNIELKLKIEDFEPILKIIAEKNIQQIKLIPQRDIYYVHPDGLLKLRIYNDKGELIFYKRDENTKDRVSNYEILNVEPTQAENYFKHIFEIETEVKKKRNLYIYKNTRIHLDEVELLGNFLELETVVKHDMKAGKEEFTEVVEFLKLDLCKQIKSSYRTLLLNK